MKQSLTMLLRHTFVGRLQEELFASQSQFILFYPFGFITIFIFIFESFLFSCLKKIEINKNYKRTKRLSSKVKGGKKILKNGKELRTHIKKKKRRGREEEEGVTASWQLQDALNGWLPIFELMPVIETRIPEAQNPYNGRDQIHTTNGTRTTNWGV